MLRKRKALVVGGSMSGLLTALLLRQSGWEVDIFERVDVELAGRGAGIVTHDSLFEVIRACGLDVPDDIGVSVQERRVFGSNGDLEDSRRHVQTLTSWDRMYQVLRSAFPNSHYHKGKALEAIDNRADGVTAIFADGTSASGDILVGADGFRSTTRDLVLNKVGPKYVGYVGWRGMVDEGDLSEKTRADLFNTFAFCLPEGEQMLGYPVAGPNNNTRPGSRRYNWVWYRPAEEETTLHDLLTDATGLHHELSIAPPLIRADVIAALRDASERTLSPQFREVVRQTQQPFFQPIYDLEVPRMVVGRVALVGDAAFVARPHCGAGVTKAGDDAFGLAQSLARNGADIDAGLGAFEADRHAFGKVIVEHARRLGAYMQAQVKTEEERRSAETFRSAAAVLKETASMEFLNA
ncbi:FAD binding domain-containing protein [Pseudosulfitobacter sp. RP-4]